MKLTRFQAEAVWLVLVHVCGATPILDEMDNFVRYAKSNDPMEFRFQGELGFGGKLYFDTPPRVSCYREDETPERKRMIDSANKFLAVLAESWTI